MDKTNHQWGDGDNIINYFDKHKEVEVIDDFAEQFAERLNNIDINPKVAQHPAFREMLTTNLHNGSILCVHNKNGRQSTAILTQEINT